MISRGGHKRHRCSVVSVFVMLIFSYILQQSVNEWLVPAVTMARKAHAGFTTLFFFFVVVFFSLLPGSLVNHTLPMAKVQTQCWRRKCRFWNESSWETIAARSIFSTVQPDQPDSPGEERDRVGIGVALIRLWLLSANVCSRGKRYREMGRGPARRSGNRRL